ncbi:hypothetical protein BT69DRAFT_421780 [Atractiella rhizophila]|nr:hypothetical protein BT69DRAFT_421780 [Atractiella rhizophila]
MKQIGLGFIRMKESHTGFNMAAAVFELLVEFGIQSKVFAAISDNASNNDTFVDCLQDYSGMHAFRGFNMAAAVFELLVEFGIQSKVFAAISDNASNNDTFVDCLQDYSGMHAFRGTQTRLPRKQQMCGL